jgi:CBS domain-containing protein
MTKSDTIGDVRIGVRDVVTIPQFQRVTKAAESMCKNRVGSLVVVVSDNDNTMVGIITERDVLEWISRASIETFFNEVKDIMTGRVIFCESGAPLDEGWTLMRKHGIRHLPVVEHGHAMAMLSARDLLDHKD